MDTSDQVWFANDQLAVRFIEEIDFSFNLQLSTFNLQQALARITYTGGYVTIRAIRVKNHLPPRQAPICNFQISIWPSYPFSP
jgi:hypothetical protein